MRVYRTIYFLTSFNRTFPVFAPPSRESPPFVISWLRTDKGKSLPKCRCTLQVTCCISPLRRSSFWSKRKRRWCDMCVAKGLRVRRWRHKLASNAVKLFFPEFLECRGYLLDQRRCAVFDIPRPELEHFPNLWEGSTEPLILCPSIDKHRLGNDWPQLNRGTWVAIRVFEKVLKAI